ncbi:MAG: 3-phosphoshikimate 1-carboxyvinyltransferase [Candidatus Latescibacterota bacterium]|nr:3-phosphoshikimate 1-carboxyvinyltransferase [Candidatus Latescibacterota bacterium]
MALPDTIEIIPLERAPTVEITVPGSKSITNRALILAALAEGEVTLKGALWSEDTQVMTTALRELGYEIEVAPDLGEPCNRTLVVQGRGLDIPAGSTMAESPTELLVANSGTTARFLTAFLCLGSGTYRVHGMPRMHERPQEPLVGALRQLGYRVDTETDRLPLVVHGDGPRPGHCSVDIEASSQFASALVLSGHRGQWQVDIEGECSATSPYVVMTRKLIDTFPHDGSPFTIEPDASSGTYFWGAGHLLTADAETPITVAGWPSSGWQVDAEFSRLLPLPETLSRHGDLGDGIMTAIVIAPFADEPHRFTDLGRLRVQECERVVALRTELGKCGARIDENGDTLEVHPGVDLHGADIDTYDDHRMAMCFAMLGLKVPGIRIRNPECVAKTFPNFFHKLATPTPDGLGAELRDGSGRVLELDELFAE